jgi:hypothetical protein
LSGEMVGHLVEITPGGTMLISEKPIKTDVTYQFKMELPDDLGAKQFLAFAARSIWCSQDIIPDFYDTGFELINISPTDIALIQQLVDAFGFKDQ